MADAVIFDLDGVIVDTEQVWDEVRSELVAEWGGRDVPEAQEAMMGMSSPEWSRYLHDVVGLAASPAEISAEVVSRMLKRYADGIAVVEGMPTIVRRLSATTPLAVASSSNRALIETALRTAGIDTCFATTVSSEEVPRGKPSPDVYLEAARRLRVAPSRCVAVEDSASGIRAAHSAGMRVLAYPNLHYPPAAETLRLASAIIASPEDILRALADG